ncbi:hypothetical protein Bpfe_013726 [Biomphalaria pfeifferi]|uniref:Uncharacterized protein n=1 Tax=Biomphalaria pfeifferi TaxID=112525 RepID=A0AAD8BLG5_BIOPF|nr:hypothetical protein Bpfe_013726 [Biomphalaria pfeifferi]
MLDTGRQIHARIYTTLDSFWTQGVRFLLDTGPQILAGHMASDSCWTHGLRFLLDTWPQILAGHRTSDSYWTQGLRFILDTGPQIHAIYRVSDSCWKQDVRLMIYTGSNLALSLPPSILLLEVRTQNQYFPLNNLPLVHDK